MLKFEEIISKFQIVGEITDVKPLGHGTVNHTYEIVCGGEHYVLQEMNHIVFKYPTEVMNNLFLVTEYLHEVIEQEGRDPQLEGLTFIRTKAGNQICLVCSVVCAGDGASGVSAETICKHPFASNVLFKIV